MDRYRLAGLEIVANCCSSTAVRNIIRHSAGWHDGSRANYPLSGEAIPLGARMLAIVDAFDSMTSDQVYRQAMLRNRALHELFAHAGRQFDPQLVESFADVQITVASRCAVLSQWLQTLDPDESRRRGGSAADRRSSPTGTSRRCSAKSCSTTCTTR